MPRTKFGFEEEEEEDEDEEDEKEEAAAEPGSRDRFFKIIF